ncbi:sensor histidine kinase [Psychroserpens sp. SPM9]|uniref:sensor histidine kinase n=1 Tax=Psychroserpens sp. SPM9 TaxID=2975598 RepID=UPI0021A35767|nr:sensor histidine kinase [Psychroserpens sp. SPM9]MDG5492548.1 sensor histidine kinase [Psychroserpens sp. SPM9]
MSRQSFVILIIVLSANLVSAQSDSELQFINDFIIPLKTHQIEHLEHKKESLTDSFLTLYVTCQLQNIKFKKIETATFQKFEALKDSSAFKKILYHINKGDYILNSERFADSKAIVQYEHALNLSKQIENEYLLCEAIRRKCAYEFKTQQSTAELGNSLSRYKAHAYDTYETFSVDFFQLGHQMQKETRDTTVIKIDAFYDLIKTSKETNSRIAVGEAYQLTGVYYMLFAKNIDSTLLYFKLAKEKYNTYTTAFSKIKSIGIEINNSLLLQKKGEYEASLTKLDSIKKLEIPNQNLREQLSIYRFLKNAYLNINAYETAYEMQSIEKSIEDSLDLIKHKISIADIETSYKTKEKEQENKKLKTDKKNLIYTASSIFLFGTIIAFLLFKNTKRKQKLAEREKELETQKLATVLKEQELTAIDAMIEGQEKERQRIANDLHDDLGGLMATIKLHFNALKEKHTPELYTKTNTLIDEAYQKVRTVAHAKNSGVIAKQGLLKAINEMADKISVANTMTIEVIDHGLENRLENSLELTIFRIVQELITNVIKHANATEVSIHITNHDDSLNIMVEDNGKGFNPSQITKTNKGMGISSIDKRIEHLNGKMTIESEELKGTTVIIDIPL